VQQLFDKAGNVRFRNDVTTTGNSGNAFAYDSFYRLTYAIPRIDLPVFAPGAFAPPVTVPPDPIPNAQAAIDATIGALAEPSTIPTWAYDLVGNRTTEQQSGGGSVDYTTNTLDQYETVSGIARRYDAKGNLRSDGAQTYIYDSLDRLTRVINPSGGELARYQHDALGRRVLCLAGGSATHIAYNGPHAVTEYLNGNPLAQIVYDDMLDVAVHLATGNHDYWYHLDPNHSVRRLTDLTSQAASAYAYSPFGVLQRSSGPYNPLQFTGHRFDDEIGSYDFRSRQYDPATGRFLQRDPSGTQDGTNLYVYATNDPLAYVDPFGMSREPVSTSTSSAPDFPQVPMAPSIGLQAPTLTLQPYNWRWSPIDPELGTQGPLLIQTDPHFEAFHNYLARVEFGGGKPSWLNYVDMGGWLLLGELNWEGDNILSALGRGLGAVGWAINKVDPDGSIATTLAMFPEFGPALGHGAEYLEAAATTRLTSKFATAAAGTALVGPLGEDSTYGFIRQGSFGGDIATQQFWAEYSERLAKGARSLGYGKNTIVVGRTAQGELISGSRFSSGINPQQAKFFEQSGVRFVKEFGKGSFHPDVELIRTFNLDVLGAAAKVCPACRASVFLTGGYRPFTDIEKAQLYLHLDFIR
jgi:RHS repeat-associated protein